MASAALSKIWNALIPHTVVRRSALPLRDENVIVREPHLILQQWLNTALEQYRHLKPRTACLATVDGNAQPAARLLRIENITEAGLTFYASYDSQKAEEIEYNPHVAVTFHWPLLRRSVRVAGKASKVKSDESERHFRNLPLEVQLSIRKGKRCARIPHRTVMDKVAAQLLYVLRNDGDLEVAMPGNWGGFLVEPSMYEFCELNTDSSSDILRFYSDEKLSEKSTQINTKRLINNGWAYEYLAP